MNNPLSFIKKDIVLASKSPRRQQLLKDLGLNFSVVLKEVEEVYPSNLKKQEVALYLSKLKADAFLPDLKENQLVITSDTIVCLDDKIIGKPKDRDDAFNMLSDLSGKMHEVVTAVTLTSAEKQVSFYVTTQVYFKTLSNFEIDYYINHYKPFDKAGSYGIQEWIGYIGIEKIVGSYFNVMGLPVKELYDELERF
ncbi:MAG: septum formation protein Maf [Flavobacteriales bacterium]|jgi:septum formation protein|nr:MAG: septum formation protein Maf [Flavobacteriales bacterium]